MGSYRNFGLNRERARKDLEVLEKLKKLREEAKTAPDRERIASEAAGLYADIMKTLFGCEDSIAFCAVLPRNKSEDETRECHQSLWASGLFKGAELGTILDAVCDSMAKFALDGEGKLDMARAFAASDFGRLVYKAGAIAEAAKYIREMSVKVANHTTGAENKGAGEAAGKDGEKRYASESERSESARSVSAQPASDRRGSDQPDCARSGSDRSESARSGSDQPASDQSVRDQPDCDRSGSARSGSDQSESDQPASDQSGSAQPASDQSVRDRPGYDPAGAEKGEPRWIRALFGSGKSGG